MREPGSGLRSAFTLLYWEGAFAMAYETWVGPTYLSGLAGELGVPVFFVTLLTSAAWIGSVGQLVGAWAYERVPSTKRYTLAVAVAARSSWLVPLALAAFWGWRAHQGGGAFPVRAWFAVTAAVACVAALFSTSSSSAWLAWMRALVPSSFHGRFFGIRQRGVMAALVAANLAASLCLGWRPHGYRMGYATIGVLALASAALSTLLLARVPETEPKARGTISPKPFLESLREPFRNREFRRLLAFSAAFNGAVAIAGPYFNYYYTSELKLPMSLVAAWAVASNAGCLIASGIWGKRIDRGTPLATLKFCTLLMAASPLAYLSRSAEVVRWIAPFEFFVNGAAWAGYSLALTALLLGVSPRERGTAYFSIHAAALGLAGALCNVLGGLLSQWLAPWGGFRALWVVASILRFAVVLGMFGLLNAPRKSYLTL